MHPIPSEEAARGNTANTAQQSLHSEAREARTSDLISINGQWRSAVNGNADALIDEISTTPVEPARVLDVGVYRGPHFYSHTPMVRIQLDLGALEDWPSHRIPGFNDALLAMLPGLERHGCSYHAPGGFVKRMRDGTWLGHVIEHVALELQTMSGSCVTRGKTRSVAKQPGVYNIMYAYINESVARLAGRLAIDLVESLLPASLRGCDRLDRIYKEPRYLPREGEPFLSEALECLRALQRRAGLGPTTQSLVAEAQYRGIPTMRLDDSSLVQLGQGRKQVRIRASVTSKTSSIASDVASDKELTKQLLKISGVPVPQGARVRDAQRALALLRQLNGPLVCKPLDGNHGRGVTLDIRTEEQLLHAFEIAHSHSSQVIVEEQLTGRDYRILVVEGQVVAVTERKPAEITGDGQQTIAQLIARVNADPRRGDGHECVMTRIKVDDHVRERLARQGLSLESVPAAGSIVQLRATANLSTGGTGIDRTDEIHPDNALFARRAALAVGLDVAGIDFLAPDISESVLSTGGGIIEVNASPGFRMHLAPAEGRPRNVARPVLDSLFPKNETACIPIFAITGTNGKSTTARMVSHILRATGVTVGMTSTGGIYVNEDRIVAVDASGPKSARLLLQDPTIDAAVLETARGGILREGLAFQKCEAATVLNISADHLGLKGIQTLEDLAAVKSLVLEVVKQQGCSVLNADDAMVVKMTRHARGRLAYFSMRGGGDMPELLRKHIADDGLAVVREPGGHHGDDIVLYERGDRTRVMAVAAIPATLGGAAEFNTQNAMAAIAMTFSHGVPLRVICNALASFSCSYEQNPGRLNIYDGHGFRVIVDYAHNPAGLSELCKVVHKLQSQHRRRIGSISIPGDRRDEDIKEMGHIGASAFDVLVFRERPDGRGRKHGEVNALLRMGAIEAGFPPERIHEVPDEHDATALCLQLAQVGDLVVLTPTNYEPVWESVLAWRQNSGGAAYG
jgi:cyanophycin synthetase